MDEVNSETQVCRHLSISIPQLYNDQRVASQAHRAIFCVQGTTT
jgi:hypothetical protein